jgi:hypothetical protein
MKDMGKVISNVNQKNFRKSWGKSNSRNGKK